jgi:streptogramin lyase
VRVDKDDNVWAVDEGTNIIQKFAPDGKLLMVLGKRPDPLDQLAQLPAARRTRAATVRTPSIARPTSAGIRRATSSSPTATATRASSSTTRTGRFIKAVGTRGNGNLQFSTPHAMAVDAKGNVYVADRGNSRIVVLDNDLNQKAVYDNVGAPWAVCISNTPHQYLYTSNSFPTGNNFDQAAMTGEIYKMELDGTVLGRFGKAVTGRRSSAASTRWTAAIRTRSTWRKSPSGACRK